MERFTTKKVIIDKTQTNKRLDQALTNIIGKYSRSQIKILLQNNNVKISNKIITNISYKVKEGEIFFIKIPKVIPSTYEPQEIPIDIVFEDEDLLVINKSAGMVTHPAPGNKSNTLVNALLYHTRNNLSSINDLKRPGIVHRLDKDTSGLLVVAKNNLSHLNLAKQFNDHSIKRKYYAFVWGVPQNQIIKGYIQRHKVNRKKMVLSNNNIGKYSETSIKIIQSLRPDIKKNTTLRLWGSYYNEYFGIKYVDFFKNLGIKVESVKKNVNKFFSQSRLSLFNYDSTGILENYIYNIPSLFIVPRDYLNCLTSEGERKYQMLLDNNLMFVDEKKLIEHINNNWSNITEWWMSEKNQKIISEFNKNFNVKADNYSLTKLKSLLSKNC